MNKNPFHIGRRLAEQGVELLRSRSKADVAHAALLDRTRWYNEHLRQKGGAALPRHPRTAGTDAQRIDFIVESAKGRVAKMAAALAERGFRVRCYFLPWTYNSAHAQEAIQALDVETVTCRSKSELFRALRRTDAFVIHHFLLEGPVVLAEEILTTLGDALPPYVVEHYDVFNGMYLNISDEWKRQERFVFEHADGVVFREFSAPYLEKELGFRFRHAPMMFLDYNLENGVQTFEERSDAEELSLAYSGGVVTEEEQPGMSLACWDDFATLCEAHHCHVHVYPANYDERRYQKYLQRSAHSAYFHFHPPVPFTQLYETITKCDYGIVPYRKDCRDKEQDGYYTREKIRCAGTNKFFDYIAAGLPIVSAMPEHLLAYLSEHGAATVPVAMEDTDFDDLKRHRNERRRQTIAAQPYFTMDAHIGDLIAYYRSLAE